MPSFAQRIKAGISAYKKEYSTQEQKALQKKKDQAAALNAKAKALEEKIKTKKEIDAALKRAKARLKKAKAAALPSFLRKKKTAKISSRSRIVPRKPTTRKRRK